MTIKLGDFFPKKSVDEPALELDDPRWSTLEGGYRGTLYDASIALKKLELADNKQTVNQIYQELWNELHHQGDVGLASYYSVPHLVRISLQKQIVDYNILGLVSVIEIQRHKDNPLLPTKLKPNYKKAIEDLAELAKLAMSQYWDLDLATTALTAIALAKGQVKLANAILNMDSEDTIAEFLESYS
ncbi:MULTISPECIES: hypothetical protein [Mucilaginibacter]|uniref:hypothetical protein n=1 Tax=Mucilaginibacter TaxID=423349 RepID=UPI0008715B49|nr:MULTISPECIES: hypothetical protein [Mucilaginibacter]GGB12773.1 hypothetical protein GCM10011500_30880 [Mucilaginibacter rubeus]SCW65428.1 hypothetical protein SAMN03159284_02817 [Mucilaginibacter sp. NFR10]